MASQEKLDALAKLLTDVLSEGQDINTAEFPFVKITGDINGKGIIWTGKGHNKQFLFAESPDRFFVSETIDLAKGKGISVNNINLISENEIGPTVTKSNLREVGRLKGLIVDGGFTLNQYLFYNPTTDRLGIGTDNPKASVNIVDMNVDLVLGSSEPNIGNIGTFNSADLELITDNTARISISAGGNITLGNPAAGDVKVTVLGKLGVNVSNPDPRTSLHVNGAIKFNDKLHLSGTAAPVSGGFSEGDIVWNSEPTAGRFVGWVCIKAGNPGLWNGFGRIE